VGRPLPAELGSYQLFDTVGRGGMADLYVARDRRPDGCGRTVVIKEVRGSRPVERRLSRLLLREAALIARLEHPNIVQVEDWQRTSDGSYAVLEYVEGLDLRELLRIAAARGTWPPFEHTLLIVQAVLAGLAHTHRRRDARGAPLDIVHRDVSPANVLLSFDGQVKLCDFGIASWAADDPAELCTVEGKAGYMSPEQARGLAADERADLFAVGIILWELCSARRMYRPSGDQSLLEVAQRAVVPPLVAQGIPRTTTFRAILKRALAPAVADRYPSAEAFLADLVAYGEEAGIQPSRRDFGRWMRASFGYEPMVLRRRARERALAALDQGPAWVARPLFDDRAPDLAQGRQPPSWPEPRGPSKVAGLSVLLVHALLAAALVFGLLWLLV
jgi:serine/threonine-protein kinase